MRDWLVLSVFNNVYLFGQYCTSDMKWVRKYIHTLWSPEKRPLHKLSASRIFLTHLQATELNSSPIILIFFKKNWLCTHVWACVCDYVWVCMCVCKCGSIVWEGVYECVCARAHITHIIRNQPLELELQAAVAWYGCWELNSGLPQRVLCALNGWIISADPLL